MGLTTSILEQGDAVQVSVTGRKWIAPSSYLCLLYIATRKFTERFYYALNNTHKLPSGSGYYEFVNLYENPHQELLLLMI